jgi:hypothetical protein
MNTKFVVIKTGVILLLVSLVFFAPVAAKSIPSTITIGMVPDKIVYAPGDMIKYQFPAHFTSLTNYLDHCTNAKFFLDPHIENISDNMPEFCGINGNSVECEDGSWLSLWAWWDTPRLPVYFHWHPTEDVFTVSGRIKENTPAGTPIKSSAYFGFALQHPEENCGESNCNYVHGTSESVVTVDNPHPVPEFPSVFLPAIFVLGFFVSVVLIRRTRE